MSHEGLDASIRLRTANRPTLDLDLFAAPGETVALLGPNGAGKTTALSVIAGILPTEAGRIVFSNVVLDDPSSAIWVPPERRGFGIVFQDLLLFPHLTVEDNVAFGLRSSGVDRVAATRRAGDALASMGVAHLSSRRPGELSGGEAQRVALARALVGEPGLLLLDEPFSSLDVTARVSLRADVARRLQSFEGVCLLVTHDPVEAFLLADRVYVVEEGRVTQEGTLEELSIRPRTRYAADLAGVNLLHGTGSGGDVLVDGHVLHLAGAAPDGSVLVTIRPGAVAVHVTEPGGSPRNTWQTRVQALEPLGDRARIRTGPPMRLVAEVTRQSVEKLGLSPGRDVWLAVKATEIGVEPE